MTDKTRRHARLRHLIASQELHSQEEIASALARDGLAATQATLSRDLRELGVLKGGSGYMLPDRIAEKNGSGSRRLTDAARTFLRSARTAGHMAVLRTGPGQASPLALEVDRAEQSGVVGTVAGDDTVFVACETAAKARSLAASLWRLANTSL